MLTRRNFLRAGASGLALLALPGTSRLASAATSRNVLVVIYLRGGADGLTLVPPYGDAEYTQLRPTISVPQNEMTPLTGFFGMHDSMPALQNLYAGGRLSVVHAVGSTDDTRSHFDAQDFMERAAPGNKTIADGWLNRYLALRGQGQVLAGISMAGNQEVSLVGSSPNLSVSSLSSFRLSGSFTEDRKTAIRALHGVSPDSILSGSVNDVLDVEALLDSIDNDTPVEYPDNSFGRRLRDLAAMIRSDIGIHVAGLSIGGWDTHDDQVGRISGPAGLLSAGVGAFYEDLGGDGDRVLTLIMTEFGRTVVENGTFGSDHGRGSVMMAVGAGIAGGNVLLKDGTWPGLTPSPPREPRRDLDVTTDFRDVFAEVLNRHLGVSTGELPAVFPDFVPVSENFPGLFTG